MSEPEHAGPAQLDAEEATTEANGRVAWAGFVLAGDIASAEALLAGHPVPRHRLSAEALAALHEPTDGPDVTLDDDLALRLAVALPRSQAAEDKAPAAEAEEPQAQLEPFAALDLAGFLSSPPAEPEWDWRGWYARGDVVLEAGDPGAGKSMLALARSVMAAQTGGELLGENIAARRVLFLDLESPDDVVYQRLYAFGLRGSLDGFAYVHRPDYLNLLDSESLARLRATIIDTRAGLVVIDSLRRAAPGLDENDSRQVSIIFSALRNLARELGCTIIVIHHPRKPVGDTKIEALHAARGSGDLTGSVDSYIFYRRLSDGLIRLEHGKARRGREHEHDHFRIVETDDGLPAIEHVIPQRVDENELDMRVLAHVTEHPGNPQNKIEGSVKGGRGSVRKSLERLATHKLLAQGPGRHPAGKYWYPANHAALSVASDAQATLGDMSPGLSQGQVVAVSPPALKGGDTSGDTLDGEELEAP